MRELTFTVPPEFDGRTVKFCLYRGLHFTEGQLKSLRWQPGAVTKQGAPVRMTDPVAAGDILTVTLKEKKTGEFTPAALPLSILYEDEDLLIVDKPAGLAVHGRSEKGDPTLGSALAYHYGKDWVFRPVNRLDKDTSGAMVIAKSGYIHDRLRNQLHVDGFTREYRAIAGGIVTPIRGVIDRPIGRSGDGWKRTVCPEGQPALTVYETLAANAQATLLRVCPETGRTHQIRVHFASLGHPLLGDWLYGGDCTRLQRQALHSSRVRLIQPVTGAEIDVTAPMPADLSALLQELF